MQHGLTEGELADGLRRVATLAWRWRRQLRDADERDGGFPGLHYSEGLRDDARTKVVALEQALGPTALQAFRPIPPQGEPEPIRRKKDGPA